MKLLLDTHALIWWLADDPALPGPAREGIAETANDVFVSAASAREVATKHRLGKLPEAAELARDFEVIVEGRGVSQPPTSLRHAVVAGRLRIAHKDPFDRLLIAQSLVESSALVSNERVFDSFGVTGLW